MGLAQSFEGRREEAIRGGDVASETESEDDEIQQEPELLPASPLSPRVLALAPPGPDPRALHGFLNTAATDDYCAEVYLIRHGESNSNTRPGLIVGRCPSAVLTAEGKRQARALGIFLLSQGVHFDAAFASPLQRCQQTAVSVCQEMNYPIEKIELSDALIEMSQGKWEGLQRSEVYTAEILSIMAHTHPDFHAPEGESQRQVEFRMVEFLNNYILPQAIRKSYMAKAATADLRKAAKENGKPNSLRQVHPLSDDDETCIVSKDLPWNSKRQSFERGMQKSRLQVVSVAENTNGRIIVNSDRPDASPKLSSGSNWTKTLDYQTNWKLCPYHVAVFSHAVAIKCLLRGLLGSDPRMTYRLCIDNTSVTVVRYSCTKGWQIHRVNDTAHLCLL